MNDGVWRAPLLRLGGGRALLGGSALLDVVLALETTQHVTGRDGYGPHLRWRFLLEQLRAEAASIHPASVEGSPELPPIHSLAGLRRDEIDSAEAARMLGCTARNVRDLHARGALPPGRMVSRRLLLDRRAVAAEVLRRREQREDEA